jgi:four helix bundle protein
MENNIHQGFIDLDVWKKARILKNDVRIITKGFPPEEKYRLVDQLIRSSRSICSNIAEGHGRYTFKDQIHFCMQARGSLSETYNHVIDAFDCSYITDLQIEKFRLQIEEIHGFLNGYIAYLRKKADMEANQSANRQAEKTTGRKVNKSTNQQIDKSTPPTQT